MPLVSRAAIALCLWVLFGLSGIGCQGFRDPQLIVSIDGTITCFADATTRTCDAIANVACVRLRVESLERFDRYTVARIGVLPGLPDAETVISEAVAKQYAARPSGVFLVEREPTPAAAPRFSAEDKLLYAGVGGAVGGAALAFCFIFVVQRRIAVSRDRQRRKAEGSTPSEALVPAATAQRRHDMADEALWTRITELEELTKRLLRERYTEKAVAAVNAETNGAGGTPPTNADQKSRGGGDFPARDPAEEMLDQLLVDQGGKARRSYEAPVPWWHRDPETALSSDSQPPDGGLVRPERHDACRGVLHPGLVDTPLARRIPAGFHDHWHLRSDFPKLPASVAGLIHVARSKLHGLGLFAARFISPGNVLFPYVSPEFLNARAVRLTFAQAAMRFGVDWKASMNFVAINHAKGVCVSAERPEVRGWGCLLNSNFGEEDLEANCEIVWSGDVPYVKTTAHIPPLAELLLDYRFDREASGASAEGVAGERGGTL